MAVRTKACDKHRFSQFLPRWLHARVVAHVEACNRKAEKAGTKKTSVTEEIERLVYLRFSRKTPKAA